MGWGAQLSIMEQACTDAEKVSGCCTATDSSWNMHSASHHIIFVHAKENFSKGSHE